MLGIPSTGRLPDTASVPRFGQLGSFCTFRPPPPRRGHAGNWVRFAQAAPWTPAGLTRIGFVWRTGLSSRSLSSTGSRIGCPRPTSSAGDGNWVRFADFVLGGGWAGPNWVCLTPTTEVGDQRMCYKWLLCMDLCYFLACQAAGGGYTVTGCHSRTWSPYATDCEPPTNPPV